jgi:putative ABC transport system permease protein
MQFVRSADMGFNKDQVVNFSMNNDNAERWPALKNRIMESTLIADASTSSTVPGNGFGKNVMMVETNEGVMESYGIDSYVVDFDYFNTLNIPITEGRNIDRKFVTDTSTSVMINEAMAARMGWEKPIGKKFQFDQDSTVFHQVVGVVKNFHQQSLYNPIEALLFIPSLNNTQALVKVDGDLQAGLSHIESAWQEIFPNLPFEYQLLDQNFLEDYESDQLRGRLFLGFAIMMIIISGLGLLGLASFTAEQRTKEISIRKVLGANIGELIMLLVKDFVWLVLIGALPAFIIGYQIMNSWLNNFEYHITIGFVAYAVVLLLVMAFVVITTGFQAYKAATINPAEKLKYE